MPPMVVTILEHQTPQLICVIHHMLLMIQDLPFCLLDLLLTDPIASQLILQIIMREIHLDLIC